MDIPKKSRDELQSIAMKALPDPIVTMGYMEHQIDLFGKVVSILAHKAMDSLTEDEQKLVRMLDDILSHSSVDFNDISNPLQAYKIPKAIETKRYTRNVQSQYLQSQIREGLFGK